MILNTPTRIANEAWYLPRGTLVIGGGNTGDKYIEAIQGYSGGGQSPVVYVPSAMSTATNNDHDPGARRLREHGFKDVRVLHTWTPWQLASMSRP